MWIWIIFWVLLAILITGTILFIVGLEAPHKDKRDNTVNYETLKWIGVGLLIFGGVGMLVWAYFKFRKPKSMMYETSNRSSFSDNMKYGNTSRSSSMNSDLDYFIKTGQMREQSLTSEQQESLIGLQSYLNQRKMSY
jgi:hypothetical protein